MTSANIKVLVAAALFALATASSAEAEQQSFASPQAGFSALAAAVKADDTKQLEQILGPEGHDIIYSGDKVADDNSRNLFTSEYEAKNRIDMLDATHASLIIGRDDWELPIPLAKSGNAWHFDVAVGKEELLNRRIGRNETATIQASLAYVDAQREYAERAEDKTGLPFYAQRFVSSSGKHNGLYWPTSTSEPPSPLGADFAVAQAVGYTLPEANAKPGASRPYLGYVFKILTAQGANAPGGKLDYIVDGKMIGGFALVASPASYHASGVMTFIVNHDGKVYQKDLGPGTAKIVAAMTTYDPDKTWALAPSK